MSGVVGINGIGLFLGDPAASTPTLVRAITYVADMVGIDHVGVSLDWTPENLEGLTAANPQVLAEERRLWPGLEHAGRGTQAAAGDHRDAARARLCARRTCARSWAAISAAWPRRSGNRCQHGEWRRMPLLSTGGGNSIVAAIGTVQSSSVIGPLTH